MVSSPRSLRPRGRDANVVREEIGYMGVHELDSVMATAATAVAAHTTTLRHLQRAAAVTRLRLRQNV